MADPKASSFKQQYIGLHVRINSFLFLCYKYYYWSWWALFVGRGGALVKSMPFDRRVVGSNPALAATLGPWASPSLTVAFRASACKLRHSVNCYGRERF